MALNGTTIVDNQPVAVCAGGALLPEGERTGSIYLHGDRTGVECRNLLLRPRVR